MPLYLGLILAQCVYVYHFWVELSDLIGAVLGNPASLAHILDAVTVEGARAYIGAGRGEKVADEAAMSAIHSPLLERGIEGARRILINVTGGYDLSMTDANEIV